MPKINLNLEAETVEEFDALLARFAGSRGGVMPEIADSATDKPATRGRKAKTDDKPAAGAAVVDPFAQPSGDGAAGASQAAESSAAGEGGATSAQPSASSPAAEAAAAEGEITVQMLKDKMAELLKAKSASFAMQTLETATGCKSLSSGSPSVVEKAKDDPDIMRRAYEALHAGISAT